MKGYLETMWTLSSAQWRAIGSDVGICVLFTSLLKARCSISMSAIAEFMAIFTAVKV